MTNEDLTTLAGIVDNLVKLHETHPEDAAEFASEIPRKIASLQLYYLAERVISFIENDL